MADYSTTMGILQPQVGKSGDILLKFEHKNGGSAFAKSYGGTRSEGFDASTVRCREPEQRSRFRRAAEGNPPKKSHALAEFFPRERTVHKEKRANCKTCLQFCSLLYAVIFVRLL